MFNFSPKRLWVGLMNIMWLFMAKSFIKKHLMFNLLLMRPPSKSYIRLKDKYPNSNVLVHPLYNNDPLDIQIMVSGIYIYISVVIGHT